MHDDTLPGALFIFSADFDATNKTAVNWMVSGRGLCH